MTNRIRDINENVDLANIYVGTKTESASAISTVNFGFKSFTILERSNCSIGLAGQQPYTIYKDLYETKYSYVDSDGNVFMPSGELQFLPSDHLRSITDTKSYQEIIKNIIVKFESNADINERRNETMLSFRKIYDDMQNAQKEGKKLTLNLGSLQEQKDIFINLYCLAFGNPLENDKSKDVQSIVADKDNLVSEPSADNARSSFKVVRGNESGRNKWW